MSNVTPQNATKNGTVGMALVKSSAAITGIISKKTMLAALSGSAPKGSTVKITRIVVDIANDVQVAGTKADYGSPGSPTKKLTAFIGGVAKLLGVDMGNVTIKTVTESRRLRRLLAGSLKIDYVVAADPAVASAATSVLKGGSFAANLSSAVVASAKASGVVMSFPAPKVSQPKSTTRVSYSVLTPKASAKKASAALNAKRMVAELKKADPSLKLSAKSVVAAAPKVSYVVVKKLSVATFAVSLVLPPEVLVTGSAAQSALDASTSASIAKTFANISLTASIASVSRQMRRSLALTKASPEMKAAAPAPAPVMSAGLVKVKVEYRVKARGSLVGLAATINRLVTVSASALIASNSFQGIIKKQREDTAARVVVAVAAATFGSPRPFAGLVLFRRHAAGYTSMELTFRSLPTGTYSYHIHDGALPGGGRGVGQACLASDVHWNPGFLNPGTGKLQPAKRTVTPDAPSGKWNCTGLEPNDLTCERGDLSGRLGLIKSSGLGKRVVSVTATLQYKDTPFFRGPDEWKSSMYKNSGKSIVLHKMSTAADGKVTWPRWACSNIVPNTMVADYCAAGPCDKGRCYNVPIVSPGGQVRNIDFRCNCKPNYKGQICDTIRTSPDGSTVEEVAAEQVQTDSDWHSKFTVAMVLAMLSACGVRVYFNNHGVQSCVHDLMGKLIPGGGDDNEKDVRNVGIVSASDGRVSSDVPSEQAPAKKAMARQRPASLQASDVEMTDMGAGEL